MLKYRLAGEELRKHVPQTVGACDTIDRGVLLWAWQVPRLAVLPSPPLQQYGVPLPQEFV